MIETRRVISSTNGTCVLISFSCSLINNPNLFKKNMFSNFLRKNPDIRCHKESLDITRPIYNAGFYFGN